MPLSVPGCSVPAIAKTSGRTSRVTPESGVCLRGLGAMLEKEEARKRIEQDGVDDRYFDPVTGEEKSPR